MMRYGLFFLLAFFWLIIPAPGQGAEHKAKIAAQDSTQIKQALQKKQQQAQKVLKKEMKLLDELERLDRQLEKEEDLVQKNTRQLRISQRKSSSLNTKIKKISQRIKYRKKIFNKRLTGIYKLTRIGTIAALFSAGSFPELLMRHKYLVLTARLDSDLMSEYQKELHLIEGQKRRLSREIHFQGHLRGERKKRLQSLNEAKEQKQKILHMVRIEKAAHMQAIAELEKAHEELSRMISSLRPMDETRSPAPVSIKVPDKAGALRKERPEFITNFKGKLISPVKGKVIERFGRKLHPKFNTVTFQKGIDIAATPGSKILSIFNGRILYSGWFPGYGKMIIIDHGKNYYSVYAHSSRLLKKAGDLVAEGELIGLVGDTGSLKGPGLYFEIRHHGVPQDPLEWIRI